MDPTSLSGAAWALAALQLAGGRPAMRQMHALAGKRLTHFSPSQLCALLWAGGSLDPGHHSPLFPALAGLVRDGMGLTLFAPHDLAALTWICGREGGGSARSISTAATAECRERLQMHAAASQSSGRGSRRHRSRQPAAVAEQQQQQQEQQDEQQREQQQQEQLPLAVAPPPPFGPAEAAMLLTGLAVQQLRVEGLVEPMLRQCEEQLATAQPNDAARILIALADLLMPVESELLTVLVGRIVEVAPHLSAQQVVAVLWAALRLDHPTPRLATLGVQHYQAHMPDYRAVDLVGMLWAVAQHRARSLPDAALCSALAALQPEVAQLSDGGLCNLLRALARVAEDRDGLAGSWLAGCAGLAAAAAAEAALGEVARRASGDALRPADLAAAASALAAHPPLAAALPASHIAALRDACAAAAAADSLTPAGVAQVAAAAARLCWADRAFVDALAGAVQLRTNLAVTTSKVFAQAVSALAALAPGRYGRLFDALAIAYAAKLSQGAHMSSTFYGFTHEERGAVLAAFAAVTQAQRLPASTLLLLVRPNENRKLGLNEVPPLLVLAAEAGQSADVPAVQAALRDFDKALRTRLRTLGPEPLLQMRAALARLQCDTPVRLAAIDSALAALGRA
ncbi:hypothetical protein C2E20_3809 [Micractinium conductrix]|uniref:Uncharacterized protein n=1 Tax=Micractinium conductrix TaxID=554055 RepID=A0A2P6VF36_9CHLO|nr:hypothetical protein C2E20_3809 [Micractinium conductrix]|eukprot:PSC72706.1 hypothetical protein C2E20_3809 [Micractinium conductrix]